MAYNLTCFNSDTDFTYEGVIMYRFRAYITPLIVIFGITGNILVIIIFIIMQKKSPCRFNAYVIGITIAQIMELLFNAFLDDFLGRGLAWLTRCNIIIKLDTYSLFLCKFFSYIPETSGLISTNVLVLFSIDRIITVFHPIQFRGDRHLRFVHLGIISIYIIGIILYLPTAINSGLVTNQHNYTLCQFVDPLKFSVQYNLYLSNIGATIIPTLIAFITTIIITVKLHKIFKERDQMCQHGDRNTNELRRIAGHLAMTTMFFILNIPLIIVVLLRQHSDYSYYNTLNPKYANKLKHLSKLFSSIKSINAAMEFPTFFTFLPSFRVHLYCLCRRRKTIVKDAFALHRMRKSWKKTLTRNFVKSTALHIQDKNKPIIKTPSTNQN
ncbi:peptide (allatostatin somatostatin)-like receptor [Schistosoma japonicum]|uniref:Peptide (Allatostatin somatostatin)-like receptor n=1 Tax=Schistosoma japonicum TaxID=6182 RepID=A0A4Z2DSP0_SCHJA|nr:peptide (allatostatin somatostatin)-like receptor [Schistosoma japonicum]